CNIFLIFSSKDVVESALKYCVHNALTIVFKLFNSIAFKSKKNAKLLKSLQACFSRLLMNRYFKRDVLPELWFPTITRLFRPSSNSCVDLISIEGMAPRANSRKFGSVNRALRLFFFSSEIPMLINKSLSVFSRISLDNVANFSESKVRVFSVVKSKTPPFPLSSHGS
ncbi:TPA: hypothetical protein ACHK8M_004973, partial [Escherichia coli]